MVTPRHAQVAPGGFELHHDDELVHLSLVEYLVLAHFVRGATVEAAWASFLDTHGKALDLSRDELERISAALLAEGLLQDFDPAHSVTDAEERARRSELARVRPIISAMQASRQARTERRRAAGDTRVRVLPIQERVHLPNLALGMLFAAARTYRAGRLNERYDLDPEWLTRPGDLARIAQETGPAVYLFSNYIWSRKHNLHVTERVKQLSPGSLVVHGGPDTPTYPDDQENYFRAHPEVDVVVRGEGEITVCEMLEALDGRLDDLSVLADVPGLTYRHGDRVVRTPDRPRVVDLDSLPSPFLTGVFDDYGVSGSPLLVIETARGCPYGCTFCDWGSNTLARMRKFSLDRVFAELDWIAEHHFPRLFLADSNYGIFARDVEIAEKMAELHQRTGFPKEFNTSYAKNTVKHLSDIIRILVGAGIVTKGGLSLQTNDPATLLAVNRSNIKPEKYDDLAATFRREGLPLYTELMIGLPGATVDSFAADLQQVSDREISARMYRTELLVNSPMNEPSYRDEWKIEIGEGQLRELTGVVNPDRVALLVSTASYTEQDMDEMMRLRQVFGIVENHAVLRHVSRFVRQEAGLLEVDLYRIIDATCRAEPERYPLLTFGLNTLHDCATVPFSWSAFYAEVAHLLVARVGVEPSGALRTVLAVQQAVMPAPGRSFPEQLHLEHDFVAWHRSMMAAKEAGEDWPATIEPLGSAPPGTITLADPDGVCELRHGVILDDYFDVGWEVRSAVSRAVPAHQRTA